MTNNTNDRRKILLVDDDTSLLVTLSDFLRYEGYDVISAESGERALEILKSCRPDLVVLDMSMPGMGGRGFLEAIGESSGRLRYPVLVLTARSSMAEYFANTPVDGFIAKPCDPSDLLLEVGRIIFLRSGEAVVSGARPLQQQPRLLLGESDKSLNDRMRVALSSAGFEVECVFRGSEIIETAIVSKPNGIVMRMEMDGMNADTVTRVLSEMPTTSNITVLVYGIDSPSVTLDQVATLETQHAREVAGIDPKRVVAATKAAVRAT